MGAHSIKPAGQPTILHPSAGFAEPMQGADNYRIGREIATGGMGSILQAEDGKLKRSVAIKVMLLDAGADESIRRRFLREAEVLAMLAHPNIVPIHDIVWEDGLPLFYSMKLVKGRTLQAVLNDLRAGDAESLREYPLVRLLSVFRKVCDALAFAHSKGVLHRDLKPENVMVGEFGEVLVMDWGLAKILGEKFPTSFPDPLLEDTSTPQPGRTLHGAVMGTPQYMSPEQAMGLVDELDERSDIHSLGAMLYAILTLRPPVEGNTPREILDLVSGGRITPPSALQSQARAKSKVMGNGRVPAAKLINPLPHLPGGHMPAALSSVAMHALHLDKAKRYQSVGALAADIESYQNGFATCAEQAGLATQLVLLVKRHRGMFGVLFAAWLLITGLAVWFVINLRAGEQRALVGETIAVREKESARKALARSSLSLAEAAQRERNGIAMKAALNEVPADLRESTWRYLDDQSDSSIARIRNGTSDVTGVAADPVRAGVFAVADRNRKVAVINVHTGERLLEFTPGFSQTDDASFYRIAFSRDGRHIAVGRDGPGGIVIHNAADGSKEREWPSPASDTVEFGAEDRLLRCGSRNLQVYDSHSGTLLWEQTVPEKLSLISALFTPAGNEIVRYTSADQLEIVSAANGSLVRKLGGRRVLYDFRMAVSPDGEMLVACDELRNTQCVSLRDGHPLYTLSGNHLHEKLHFTADGARLVTVSVREDGVQSIDLWNAKTGDPLRSVLGGQGAAAGMSVHPLSDELLVTGPDSRAWDLSGPLPGWRLPAVFTGSVTFWGGDDSLFGIAPGTTDWGLLRLKPGGADVLWQAEDQGSYASGVSKDGNTVALARPGVRTEVLILRKTGSAVEVIRKIPTSIDPYRLRLSPEGDRLLVMERVRHPWMLLVETATGKDVFHLDLEGLTQTNELDWLDDHRLVGLQTLYAKRGNPGAVERITIWDADTGKIQQSAINPTAMNALAISPDCSRIAEAGSDKILRIRDSATLKVIQQFRVHDAGITALAWNPVHSWVATASADLSVKVWDLETGRCIAEFHGMLAAPAGMAFSPSGRLLGTLSSDEEIIRIWQIDEAVPAAR